MIDYFKNFYDKIKITEKIFIVLFCFFPISIILGNLLINLTFFLILIIFFIELSIYKNFSFIKDRIVLLLMFFFFSLLINCFFSTNVASSLPRVFKILEIIAFIIILRKIILNYEVEFENLIFGFWGIIFSVLIIDIIFELIFGYNILGFKSYMPGRIASFFGNELIVGSFFICFSSFFIGRISKLFQKNISLKLTSLIIFLITISFLIGERSNFIKYLIISAFLYSLIVKIDFKYKVSAALVLIATLFLFFNFNENIKYRYYSQNIVNFKGEGSKLAETNDLQKAKSQSFIIDTKNTIQDFIKWTEYGAQYNAAYQIFLAHPYFGVGIKNYRTESYKEKYKNEEYKWTDKRITTHPHQIHFEFLSETGLFGYITFLIFISLSLYLSVKNYLIYKNFFQLGAILYVATTLIPLLPSGSFFSTYTSSLFWINYAIMVSYIKQTKS